MRVLFVRESQPKGPQFFYNGKRGKVADNFRKALPHLAGADPLEFLANFQAAGFYLTDLVKVAVNAGAVTPKERARLCRESVPDLRDEIAALNPDLVVCFMKGIAAHVEQAAEGFAVRTVSFPATEMKEISGRNGRNTARDFGRKLR